MKTSLQAGQCLPEIEMRPTAVQLFRYSAVTWNAHRIHYDREWAAHEGHQGLVVQSHLHAANVIRAVTSGLGPAWRVAKVRYRILRPAFVGDILIASAEVAQVSDDGRTLELVLKERTANGETCLEGAATASVRP